MVRISGSHPGGLGSIPGNGILFQYLFIIEITDYHFSDDQLEAEIGQALAARHQEPSGELD